MEGFRRGRMRPEHWTAIWYKCHFCSVCFEFRDLLTEHQEDGSRRCGQLYADMKLGRLPVPETVDLTMSDGDDDSSDDEMKSTKTREKNDTDCDKTEDGDSPSLRPSKTKFRCNICKKIFKEKCHLEKHNTLSHPQEDEDKTGKM